MAGAERSTKAQVQAYRFGLRRLEYAVQNGSALRRSLASPRHGLALGIGAVISAVIVVGATVYGHLVPEPSLKDAKVLIDRDTGGTYVVLDGVAHPSMNLASALLAAPGQGNGSAAVRQVTNATLSSLPQGQLVGIPGAPQRVPSSSAMAANTWTVCDIAVPVLGAAPGHPPKITTTVLIGASAPTPGPAWTSTLVTVGGRYYVLHDGVRSQVDLTRPQLLRAAGIDPAQARPVSLGLLNAIPAGAALSTPTLGSGPASATAGGRQLAIGEVLSTTQATAGKSYYVVLAHGVQQINAVVADVIRATQGSTQQIPQLPPSQLPEPAPAAELLPMSGYPSAPPQALNLATQPGLCLDRRLQDGVITDHLVSVDALPLPAGAHPVPAPPLPAGPPAPSMGSADQVYLKAGTGLAAAQSINGTSTAGDLFLITDEGLRYGVVNQAAMQSLGLTTVVPVPAQLLQLLPSGPMLDPVAARRYFAEQKGAGGA